MIRVTFLSGWRMYNAGETAAFFADQAQQLIAGGLAVETATIEAAETDVQLVAGKNPKTKG